MALSCSSSCPIHGPNGCNCIPSQEQQHHDEQSELHRPKPPANAAILIPGDYATDHATEEAKNGVENEHAKMINERERSRVKENEDQGNKWARRDALTSARYDVFMVHL
jgi:hypothetical protein